MVLVVAVEVARIGFHQDMGRHGSRVILKFHGISSMSRSLMGISLLWAGLTDFKPGYWIGVRYDEPLGKNDGR